VRGFADLKSILAFPVCAAGGAVAWWAGVPAPWLAGAMVAAAAAGLAGLPVKVPKGPTTAILILLGVQIGASVTWETLHSMLAWPATMATLVLAVAAVIWAGYFFYRRVMGWDRATSFYAANPGALALNLLLAEKYGARVERVAIIQCMRLFFLVAGLPLLVSGFGDGGAPSGTLDSDTSVPDLIVAILAGAVAGLGAERVGLPGGALLGALIVSAALHLGGVVHGILPGWVVIPCFIVLGMVVGARFQGLRPVELAGLAMPGTLGFLVAVAVSSAGAVVAALLSGLPVALTLLAFAPGAIEVMLILAFALQLDPAFVAAHQVSRYLILSIVIPIVAEWMNRRPVTDD
jgi:hypothetical protein